VPTASVAAREVRPPPVPDRIDSDSELAFTLEEMNASSTSRPGTGETNRRESDEMLMRVADRPARTAYRAIRDQGGAEEEEAFLNGMTAADRIFLGGSQRPTPGTVSPADQDLKGLTRIG
jgi:hypothetical protein